MREGIRAEATVFSEGHLCHLKGPQPCSRPSTTTWKERAWGKTSAAGGTGVEGIWKPQVLTKPVSSDKGLTWTVQNKENGGDCRHSPLAWDC